MFDLLNVPEGDKKELSRMKKAVDVLGRIISNKKKTLILREDGIMFPQYDEWHHDWYDVSFLLEKIDKDVKFPLLVTINESLIDYEPIVFDTRYRDDLDRYEEMQQEVSQVRDLWIECNIEEKLFVPKIYLEEEFKVNEEDFNVNVKVALMSQGIRPKKSSKVYCSFNNPKDGFIRMTVKMFFDEFPSVCYYVQTDVIVLVMN
jgi:hypothetical protein